MKRGSIFAWFILILAALYFIMPLLATFDFALRQIPDSGPLFTFMGKGRSFDAFFTAVTSPDFQVAFGRSVLLAIAAIGIGIVLVVPTVYLIRLRFPQWRSPVEFVTLLPLVVPAIILVFGYTRLWVAPPWSPFKSGIMTDVLLAIGYVTLALPYMYRSVDIGMRAIDVKTLTEAAQSLGASGATVLFKVILPNVRSAVLSGSFITFAIVLGEFTFASLLGRDVFGTYLENAGKTEQFKPSALALIAFFITWACMGLIQFVGRSPRARPAR